MLIGMLLCVVLGGCARQERIVSYRPMMSDLPVCTIGSDVVGDDDSKRRTAADATPDYFVEEEDGRSTPAQIPTGAYLVYHVRSARERRRGTVHDATAE